MNTEDNLIQALLAGPVNIAFTKADGTVREMRATLSGKLVPAEFQERSGKPHADNPDVQKIFDLDANGWRSYRKANLLAWGMEVATYADHTGTLV